MLKKKIVIPGMATALVAVALVVGIVVRAQMPVSATELTNRTLSAVSSLSPNERKDLNARINGDAQKELESARKAKDLKVLTYEEYKKQAARGPGIIAGPGELPSADLAKSPDMTKLHYLMYVDSDDTQHVIGVDENSLPVFVMTYRSSPTGEQGSVMMVDDKGQPAVSAAGSAGFGASQCVQEPSSDKPTCTTQGGTSAATCTHASNGNTKCMAPSSGSGAQQ